MCPSPSTPTATLPLPTLLSQTLVAFTIEFDNEAERLMQHRTTRHGAKFKPTGGSRHAPWLVSMVMWSNCMQFVGEKGVRVRELERLARTNTHLNGMERWGYITVQPDPADERPKPPRSDWVIHAKPGGRAAREVWRPLFGTIEKRWQERFGREEIAQLRDSLMALIKKMDLELPDCLPILGYGLFSARPEETRRALTASEVSDLTNLPLPAYLSKVLLAFAIEFEKESEVSLAICANLLRVLSEKGKKVGELPRLSGVSKEGLSMAMGILQKRGLAETKADLTAGRAKMAHLTAKGRKAQEAYQRLLGLIEERWEDRFGKDGMRKLREGLERLAGPTADELSPLFQGLQPHADGWRASVPRPNTLPHYPMVLHRGGFPDGA
jgi:DNA-binding MarR family transcriptional regulator